MSIAALVSLLIGMGSLIVGFLLEGGHLTALFEYTAAVIVVGGTIGAVALSFPFSILKKVPAILKIAFGKEQTKNMSELILYFKDISIRTRKDGLLSIEETISSDEALDPFIKKGLQLVVDGVEPQTVKTVLESEAYMISERHKAGIAIFESAGGYAPTLGIMGTVMGLVHVLGNLENPDTLGPQIAVAFIATLYGVATANIIYLPIGGRLKAINNIEEQQNEMIIEAIISIQEGLNPNTLVEKLKSFLDKDELNAIKENKED
ncbi:MAG: flagellar motor protein [Clostridium sp.]|uniref:flagellar motor protein n=1 Tax=Clostridium sp. TaxID=1506 RepID=UPI002FCB9540